MKPFQTLVFIFSIFLVLFLMAWFFPENGIQIGKDIHLKFASVNDYFEKDTVRYADISSIIQNTKVPLSDDEIDSLFQALAEFSEQKEHSFYSDTLNNYKEDVLSLTYALEYAGKEPVALFPFFSKLKNLDKQKKLVRILHYGDSQIEADRMSSFIRYKMQLAFGGSGCGTVPAVPLYNGQSSVKQEYSENWIRHTSFGNSDDEVGHQRYGALMSFARQNAPDTLKNNKNRTWFKLETSPLSFATSRKYSEVSLFIQGDFEPVNIKLYERDKIIDSLNLRPSASLRKLNWHFRETPGKLKFSFSGRGFTNIYGISLDNSWGVALDNIPLRGSSGLVFSKTDTAFLSQMYGMMDVGMIILQFGGNVIPYMKDNFSAYERYFSRELSVFKKILPGIPVIVIGPSDMSIKEKDMYITYPNLEGIRDAMRKATIDAGFVFWDMYNAMGGKNSMPSWVSASPPLAASDYVHFNNRGAKIIAEMFSNALLNEYKSWNVKTSGPK
jgi:lysophospholipase L1-like esterase/flavodoxin